MPDNIRFQITRTENIRVLSTFHSGQMPMPPPHGRSLLGRSDANRDQRRVLGARNRTTGSGSFAQELRRVAGRTAISGNEDLVVTTLHRAIRPH